MDEINNQSTSQYPTTEEKGPFTLADIIKMILAIFFIILILLSWFGPDPTEAAASRVGSLLMIMGIVTGISFISTVSSKTRHSSTIVRLFGFLVGIVGGIFIFLVGVISGIIGSFKANPS